MITRSKRPILLLEVMIAMALIVMAAIPLIYPHLYLLRSQRGFIDKIHLDHAVNRHYVTLLEKLYQNQIPFAAIVNEQEFPLPADELYTAGEERLLPFTGHFRFKARRYKPKNDPDALLVLYLVGLDYEFITNYGAKDPLKYHYDLFIVRDLSSGELPPGEEDSEDEDEE